MIDCGFYCMDCFEGMSRIDDKSIDMILCDLPYGTTKNKWDKKIPFEPLWKEYKRIIKDDGAIVLFSQQPFTSALIQSNPKLFKYEWIWEKNNGTGFLNVHHAPLKCHENIVVFSKGQAAPSKNGSGNKMVYHPQMEEGGKPYKTVSGKKGHSNYGQYHNVVSVSDGKRYPRDVVRFPIDRNKIHPTQKPVALCEYLIRTYTDPGDIVLDNCAGSGTTLLAAENTGRRYIGFESNKEIYEEGVFRLLGWKKGE